MGYPVGYKAFFDLSGGQNDTVSEVNVSTREGSRLRNINLERDGAASKRLGADQLNPGAALTGEIGMIFQLRQEAGVTPKILVAAGQTIQEWVPPATFNSLLTGLTNNRVFLPGPYRSKCYLTNGTDDLLVYLPGAASSPYIFRPGAPAPSTPPAKTADIAGSMGTGNILVRVRYVGIEGSIYFGDPHPEDGVTIAVTASGGVTISVPTYPGGGSPADFRVVDRIVERTTVGGGIFIEDGRLGDNTTTSYDITQSDTALQANDVMPDVGLRETFPTLWPMTIYKNRVVGADPANLGRIVWSEIDEFGLLPSFKPDINEIILDVEDWGDAPAAVGRLGEYLVWYCGRSIHLLAIDAAGNGYTRKVNTHNLGFPSARGILEFPDGHLVWSYKGPYFFDGRQPIFVGERIEKTIREEINKAQLEDIYGVHRSAEQRRQACFVVPGLGSNYNDLKAKYHYRRATLNPEGFPTIHAWAFDDGFRAKSGAIVLEHNTNEEIEYSGDYNGFLYREDYTNRDDHDDNGLISGEYVTGWLDMDQPHMVKDFEDIWVFTTGELSNTLTLEWKTEFGRGPSGSATLDLADPSAVARFDTAIFDTDVFYLGEAKILHAKLGEHGVNAQGKFIQFRFLNNAADEPFTLVGFVVKSSARRDRNE